MEFRSRFLKCGGFDRRSWLATIIISASIVLISLLLTRPTLTIDRYPDDGHALVSLDLAIEDILCGQANPRAILMRDLVGGAAKPLSPRYTDTPLLQIPRTISGEKFCATESVEYTNNENTLMFLIDAILRVDRAATMQGLARDLLIVQGALIFFFTAVATRLGLPLITVAGSSLIAFAVLTITRGVTPLSLYPFLAPALLGYIASLLLFFETRRAFVYAATIGIIAAVLANLRTSYAPLLVALFFATILFSRLTGRTSTKQALFCVAAYLITFVTCNTAIVRETTHAHNNLAYHVVWHPMVLSLAVPENPLSKREGIAWSDSVGLTIARRVDPGVGYVTPEYERALSKYYFGLWRKYPREMASIYLRKFEISGVSMWNFQYESVVPQSFRRLLAALLMPLHLIGNGVVLFFMLAAASIVALMLRRERLLFPFLAFSATMLLQLQQAVVIPFFNVTHHNSLLVLYGVTISILATMLVRLAQSLFDAAISKFNPLSRTIH